MFALSHALVHRVVTVCVGGAMIAGLGMLAGCPSRSTQSSSTPPPVALAAVFHGVVFGGRQPIAGASVLVLASGTSVGAVPSVIGSAITTGAGSFGPITLSPAPVTGQVVYVLAAGGNAGGGTNTAIKLLSVAGIGGSVLTPVPGTVNIDELTTVASTAALENYLSFAPCASFTNPEAWPLQGISTCPALDGATGLAKLAATVENLINPASGQASDYLASQPEGSPLHTTLEKLDTLANILSSCVNASGPTASSCTQLFAAALNNPENTLKVAWLFAAAPAVNQRAGAIGALAPESPIYTPVLAAPAGTLAGYWTIAGNDYVYGVDSANYISAWRASPLSGALLPVTTGGAGSCGGSPDPMNCFGDPHAPYALALGPRGRTLFVANATGNDVASYAVQTDGSLAYIGSAPAGTQPDALAVDPSGRYLYAANEYGHSISAYRIGLTGGLTLVGTVPSPATSPSALAVDPSGSYLYVACGNFTFNGYNIGAYAIQPGGALSALGAVQAGYTPFALAMDPSGKYLYAANVNSNDISQYAILPGGVLSAIAPAVAVGSGPISVAVSPDGKYLYEANRQSATVVSYAIGAHGTLSTTPAASVPAGTRPVAVTIGTNGRFVYAADFIGKAVYAFTTGADGTLAPVALSSPYAAGNFSYAVMVDALGRSVYAANDGDSDISAWRLDDFTGALVPIAAEACAAGGADNCYATDVGPEAVVGDPSGRYVYTSNDGPTNSGTVSAFTEDASDGTLATLGGTPVSGAGRNPYWMTVSPDGRFAYVVSNFDNTVTTFAVASMTAPTPGALVPIATTVTGYGPFVVAEGSAGRYLYVGNSHGGISAYTITQAGGPGTVGAPQPITDGGAAACPAASPDPGNCFPAAGPYGLVVVSKRALSYVYAANGAADTVSVYSIAPVSSTHAGALIPVDTGMACVDVAASNCYAAGQDPVVVTADPSGSFLYVSNNGGDDVSAWSVGAGGILTPVTNGGAKSCGSTPDSENCFPSGFGPSQVSVDPTGRFVYVGSTNASVSVYGIAPASSTHAGALIQLHMASPFPAGTLPHSITAGP